MDEVHGKVTAKGTNQFTLQTRSGTSLTINVDANTRFDDFDEAGLVNTFASLAVGQTVEVDLRLMPGGGFLARKVELENRENEQENEEEVEGVVTGVDTTTQTIHIVVLDEMPDITGINLGNQVDVKVQSGALFRIRPEELSVPAGLAFTSLSDVMVGQEIQVRRRSGSTGTTVQTDLVRLRMTQFTAKVAAAPSGNTFTLNSLPPIFTGATPPVTSITVQTSSQTNFGNGSLGSLTAGTSVSVRGLLFKGATPTLVAKKVRIR